MGFGSMMKGALKGAGGMLGGAMSGNTGITGGKSPTIAGPGMPGGIAKNYSGMSGRAMKRSPSKGRGFAGRR